MEDRAPAPLSCRDLVLCDFDGTISAIDTGLLVARALGFEPFDEIEQRWRRGEISARQCLRDQWALIDLARPEFWELIDHLEIDPGFGDLLALVRQRAARLVVLSDGLDLYIERTLRRLGLKDVEFHANHAAIVDGHIDMQFPHGGDCCLNCGNCKTQWLFDLRPGRDRVIYVGDGFSDVCASRFADLVFAKDDLADVSRRHGYPFVPFESLAQVTAQLR